MLDNAMQQMPVHHSTGSAGRSRGRAGAAACVKDATVNGPGSFAGSNPAGEHALAQVFATARSSLIALVLRLLRC